MPAQKVHRDVTFNGTQTSQVVDVSLDTSDATTLAWILYGIDLAPILGAVQPIGVTQVKITITPAPPAGTYRLTGIG